MRSHDDDIVVILGRAGVCTALGVGRAQATDGQAPPRHPRTKSARSMLELESTSAARERHLRNGTVPDCGTDGPVLEYER